MTEQSADQLFRQAAEAEDGMPVSAGALIGHMRLALASGRAITVDLSQVPDELRGSLVAEIRELVRLAASRPKKDVQPPPDASSTAPP